jgi:hypothetical protein
MLPIPHIPDQVYFGSSGYPLRVEAGLGLQLNTSVNNRSRIFTDIKSVGCWVAGESLRERISRRFRENVAVCTEPNQWHVPGGASKCHTARGIRT